ncbi:MAG TPA: toxic anion resistance protein [Syntrophobacteraceae bacterium]|nr:toxic anion resistance protein [Syntrophobacteraceae bacterium]
MSETQSQTKATPMEPSSAAPMTLDVVQIRQESALPPAQPDEALQTKARDMAKALTTMPEADLTRQDEAKSAVEDMGRSLQQEAARRSAMLQQPIRTLAKSGEDGGPVANSLVDLKMKVEELDPAKFDFKPGWLSRTLGFLPVVGNPIKRYFTQFESAQTVINAIISSLEKGREQLRRDNVTLGEDQRAMRELTLQLQRQVQFGELLDGQLQNILEREMSGDEPRRAFIEQELLFPLRQRVIDLQTQLAVNQQGILAIGVIVQNNKELIRGVNRALDVTVSALQVAVVVALALANQKIVLDKISALNVTTTNLITGTAERLRTQGAEIHKQAASSTLDLEALKRAFTDITTAIDDIARYRREALPQMAQTIVQFDELCAEAEGRIKKAEEGERARPKLTLDLEASA